MKQSGTLFRKIIWAVDPHAVSIDLQLQTARAIEPLCIPGKVIIEPVSVVTHSSKRKIGNEARERFQNILDKTQLPNLQAPCFLAAKGFSARVAVQSLIEHARDWRADLIALSTHGRHGMSRWFMGSFAETLILSTEIPVLVSNPKSRHFEHYENILFPTDFSPVSKTVFLRVLDIAAQYELKILLFHKVDSSFPPVLFGSVPLPLQVRTLQQTTKEIQKEGARWVSLAAAEGVRAKLHLAKSSKLRTAEAVVHASRHMHAPLIAMASQSGTIGNVLLGSVTRQVIRHSECPALVIHPVLTARQRKLSQKPLFEVERTVPLLS